MVEYTTLADAAVEEITDTSSQTCGFSHTFQSGFSLMSPKAYLAAFETNLGVGSCETGAEEEATSRVPKMDQTTLSAPTRSSSLTWTGC